MIYTEHKITLDIHKIASSAAIRVKKGDTARRLLIHLTESGSPYHIDADCYAVFTALKPDGKVIFNNCRIDDCEIIYDFTEQTVAAIGLMPCEIILYGGAGKQLTSASFQLFVEDTVYDTKKEIESTSEFNALADLIAKAQALIGLGALAPAIVCEAKGEKISLTDASNMALQGLRIFGKSTQDGTPTPANPVEIVNIGAGGSIEVKVLGAVATDYENAEQSVVVSTPGGLPGIPVTSGGNYTDSEGRQWICDEVDMARGVYVQRIAQYQVSSVRGAYIQETTNGIKWAYGVEVKDSAMHTYMGNAVNYILNNKFPMVEQAREDMESVGTILSAYGHANYLEFRFRLMKSEYADKAAVEAAITGTVIYYLLAEPIETPLAAAEIAAFTALHTYKPNTCIHTDVGAYAVAEYVADTKIYIGRNGGGGAAGSAVSISEVTIRAANWVANGATYYQVVAIDGVTEYSQVDLKPSVEQLAIFHDKDLAFVTENDGGIVTVYAIGEKPENDYTIQVSITEVHV